MLFGTKNLKLMRRQHLDLIVQNHWDITQFGLTCATRFDIDLAAKLLYNDTYFGVWHGRKTPVIGTLTRDYLNDYAFKVGLRQSPQPPER